MPKSTGRAETTARKAAGDAARARAMPYRLLLVVIVGSVLALVLAAFNVAEQLSPRTTLLLLAGVLILLAAALEVVFRDLRRERK